MTEPALLQQLDVVLKVPFRSGKSKAVSS